MWPANLSVRLRVVALVSRYLTNKLIRNRLLPDRRTFEIHSMRSGYIIWYYRLSQSPGYISDSLLTRSPLTYCYVRATCMS